MLHTVCGRLARGGWTVGWAVPQITRPPLQQGTTVSINGLFSTLPVRLRELNRNIKKVGTRSYVETQGI